MILTGRNGCVGVYQEKVLVSTHESLNIDVMDNILSRDADAEVSDRACDCKSVLDFPIKLVESKQAKGRLAKATKKE